MLNAGRRVVAIMALALLATACAGVNPQKFEAIDQAGHAIAAVFGDHPTLQKFRPLRQAYSTALRDLQPKLSSSRERTLFGDFEVIDQRLSEMLTLWERLDVTGEELVPVAEPVATAVRNRYELPVNTNEPPSIYANEALVALREDIKDRLTKAHERIATP